MVIQSVLWMVLPGVFLGLTAVLMPGPGLTPRWRRRLRQGLDRIGSWCSARFTRRRPDVGDPEEPDPFEVLAVQMRLAVVAAHLRDLEGDQQVWGLRRRLEATQAAYDDLLAEACQLAGIPIERPPVGPQVRHRTEPERLDDELALAERGWSW